MICLVPSLHLAQNAYVHHDVDVTTLERLIHSALTHTPTDVPDRIARSWTDTAGRPLIQLPIA